jgi:UDP-2-acetamido-3-amino-2,3-dideoxy-glucuronate N-acetyltransferase
MSHSGGDHGGGNAAITGPGPARVHPTATVDDGAQIGAGTRVWHYCHVMSGARIGERCILGQNVFVGATARIGDGVKVQNNVSIYDAVELEDEVFCGPSMVFTNVINPRAFIERKREYRPTLVRRGATLGANCTILCGHTIGAYALIGAGAVVTHDVPDYALMVGVPARHAGWVCRCGATLVGMEGPLQCTECGARYRAEGLIVQPEEQ